MDEFFRILTRENLVYLAYSKNATKLRAPSDGVSVSIGMGHRQRASTATWSGTGYEWRDTAVDGIGHTRNRGSSQSGTIPVQRDARPVTHLGPYRLIEQLGAGGMAQVFLAEHTLIGKRVAIKMLLPRLNAFAEAREMFVREARIACSIRHHNLVDTYDFAMADDRPYCVMELVDGETLAARLRRGAMPLSQCLDVTIQLADAVAAVHAAGYLHRDIKAENVLLARNGRRIEPKLIDFGIAVAIRSNGVEAPMIEDMPIGLVGTPRTMAPEQIAQEHIDERTDIWALGILCYEMMTGHLPFPTGVSLRDDMLAIVTEPTQPLPVEICAEVRAVVESCLHKDPENRPECAALLATRLRAARADYLARNDMIDRMLVADEAWSVIEELVAESELAA